MTLAAIFIPRPIHGLPFGPMICPPDTVNPAWTIPLNIPNGTGFSRYTATIVVIVEVFSFSSRYTTPCVAVGIFG
jgi:hypothetical protein